MNDDDEECYRIAEGMVFEPTEGVKNDRGVMGCIKFLNESVAARASCLVAVKKHQGTDFLAEEKRGNVADKLRATTRCDVDVVG